MLYTKFVNAILVVALAMPITREINGDGQKVDDDDPWRSNFFTQTEIFCTQIVCRARLIVDKPLAACCANKSLHSYSLRFL
jgi:hypothetical protein